MCGGRVQTGHGGDNGGRLGQPELAGVTEPNRLCSVMVWLMLQGLLKSAASCRALAP